MKCKWSKTHESIVVVVIIIIIIVVVVVVIIIIKVLNDLGFKVEPSSDSEIRFQLLRQLLSESEKLTDLMQWECNNAFLMVVN